MSDGLYLGRQVDPGSGELGARVDLDPADLLTHGLIVGMTGSGKTGMAIVLLEELLRRGVPVLAIDPKGDLGNLLLLFETLDAASFEPWIDAEAVRRDGRDVPAAARETAQRWKTGLADWELGPEDIAALKKAHDATIYTPGSTAGVPLNVLQSLEAPPVPFESAEEDLRDEIGGIVAGLLGLLRIDADPLQSREAILLENLIEHGWRAGKGYGLESLIGAVADPPFEKLGALPVETVFPARDRQGLMLALNNLLAAPSFQTWREGPPLDVEQLLYTPEGRPRLSVVHTAHLRDEERQFVTALLLDKVKTWMRRQGGTSELRALVYMDEVFGYFPPHPANPPTKRPLLTLLKQARAQGVGVVLATQNPVDLDYKGLSNMGIWMVGTLQTDRDRDRLDDGLTRAGLDRGAVKRLLAATRKRVFLLHDVHRDDACLVHSRWAMSYLRGPLTREEISRLTGEHVPAAPGDSAGEPPGPSRPPVLPAPFTHRFLAKHGGELAELHLLVKHAARYKGGPEVVGLSAWPLHGATPSEALEAEHFEVGEGEVSDGPVPTVRYGALPGWLADDPGREIERALRQRLPDRLSVTVFVDPDSGEESAPGESADDFVRRLHASRGGQAAEKVRARLEKKKSSLAEREEEVEGRRQEKWFALGRAVLKMTGLLGRRRGVTGIDSVLTKNRLEDKAEARLEAARAEVAELQSELDEIVDVDSASLQEKTLRPTRGGVKVLRYDLVWVY
jgi:hypothetical protein